MTIIVDYGLGNIFSLKSSLERLGGEVRVSRCPQEIQSADRLLLPGVGAFGDAVQRLKEGGLWEVLREVGKSGKPLLGICLGMQLLLSSSTEYGDHEGLGLLEGEVKPIQGILPEGLAVPHMGWNCLHKKKDSPLFEGVGEGSHVYFVHSYAGFSCGEDLLASTEYGLPLTAAVGRDRVYGTQFHPEKSGEIGLRILKNFLEL